MNTAVFVLFTRALSLDASRFTTYLMRMALVFVIVFVLVDAQSSAGSIGAPGLRFFANVSMVTLVFITIAAIFLFAVVISEEKEESTIGLLKMAGLSPVSIILGKGGSRLVFGLMLLLAQFPFTLLAITLGGAEIHQIFAGYCTVVAYLLFAGMIGIFASVWCRSTSRAIGTTLALLFLFLLGPYFVTGILDLARTGGILAKEGIVYCGLSELMKAVIAASPFERLGQITVTGFDGAAAGFQVISNLAGAVALFLVSWAVFERRTSEDRVKGSGRGFAFARTSRLGAIGVGRAWGNALAWKEYFFGTGGFAGLFARFVVVGGIFALVSWMIYRSDDAPRQFREYVGDALMITALVVFYVDFLIQIARTLNAEWRLKTLPALVLLPISTSRLFLQKVCGCLAVAIPYVVLFGIGAVVSPQDFFEVLGKLLSEPGAWMVLMFLVFFLYMTAYMSLLMKWMGLLASAAICLFGSSITAMILRSLFDFEGGIIVLILVSLGFLALLHVQLLRLIERRAGE